MDDGKKKVALITVCSLLLVAMVVALVIAGRDSDKAKVKDVSGSKRAVTSLCQTTDYQQTCMDSLKGQNSSNPKELIAVAFQATIDYIKVAANDSTTLKGLQKDPKAKQALDTCNELANNAIDDLQRSLSKFTQFDVTIVGDVLLDLKIWLSGAITHQETCLDGFDQVEGDAGLKMKDILTTSMHMTSNALAMVAEISTYLESMGDSQGGQSSQSRRLLSEDHLPIIGHGDELPDWLDLDDRRSLLAAHPQKIKPNIVVAKDGSGHCHTINEALKHVPKKNKKRFILYIKEGVYKENVHINSSMKYLMMIGDGPTKTRITGNLNFIDGTGTYHTATVALQGDFFIARGIGFENSAGAEKHQAVALRVSADKVVFYDCHMDGYQDTLYAHTYRQFYRDCVISGTIDFIFGDCAGVFQGCTMLFRKPLDNQQNIVTAQGRKELRQPTGFVLQNCTFKADPELYKIRTKVKSYLGRPWKEYSRTIIMESFLDDLIQPDGWMPWNDTFALDTLFYTEFNNRGPASPKAKRVKWPGVKELPPNRIQRFTAAKFLDGNRWIPRTRVPYSPSFIFPVPKEDPNIKYSPVVPEENKDLGPNLERSNYVNKNASSSSSSSSNDTKTPPPTPTTPPVSSTPTSDIAAPPSFSQVGSDTESPAAAPAAVETGDLIIDLSPSVSPAGSHSEFDELVAPAAAPTNQIPVPQSGLAPAASPSSTLSPSLAPVSAAAASPSNLSPSAGPVSAAAASPSNLSPSSGPVSAAAASPSNLSPSSGPVSAAAASPSNLSPSSGPVSAASSPSMSPVPNAPQSDIAPISPTAASDAPASSPTSSRGPSASASAPQSEIANSPQSPAQAPSRRMGSLKLSS